MTTDEACIIAGEKLQKLYGEDPIPVSELNDEVVRLSGNAKSGVLIGDRCYNRHNEGKNGKEHLFVFISPGKYKYVGPKFLFTGEMMHKPKSNKEYLYAKFVEGKMVWKFSQQSE